MLLAHSKFKLLLLAALLALLTALAATPARADKRDHDLARQALQNGAVLPLRAILDIVEERYPGQIMEVEFEHDEGQFTYELKVLQSGGRLIKLELDARNGNVIKAKHNKSGKKPEEEKRQEKRDKKRRK